MAASTKTAKQPVWKQAQKWDEYFRTEDGEKNVSIEENSTGYQLYAVNDQTIASSLTGFTSGNVNTISTFISENTLNLQLADAVYNKENQSSVLSRQRLSWCNTIQKNIEIV